MADLPEESEVIISKKTTVNRRSEIVDMLVLEGRRFRRGFTKENVVNFLKSLAWVVPLTVLIWIWAERSQLSTADDVSAPIAVTATDDNRLVTLEIPAEHMITLNLKGPKNGVDRVTRSLVPEDGGLPVLDIKVGAAPAGDNYIETIQAIGDNALFKDNGVTVEQCSPPTLKIRVDVLKDVQVPVQNPDGLNIENATFDPPTVTLRGPEDVLAELQQENKLFAVANIAGLPGIQNAGPHDYQNVQLLPPQSEHLAVSPKSANVSVTVKSADVTWTLPKVPIFIATPNGFANKYSIELDHPFVPNVELKGSPEAKQSMLDPNTTILPRAIAVIADASGGPAQAQYIDLPPGVTVVRDDLDGKIPYTVVDRGAP